MPIPILGQPQIIFFHPQALIKCSCSSSGNTQLLLLNGLGNIVACPRCGTGIAIQTIAPKPNGEEGYELGLMVIPPASKNLM